MAGGIRRKHSDERSGPYLVTACDYVHLNPARVRLVAAEEPLESRGRSSDPAYLRPQLRTPGLRVDRVMGEPGLQRTGRAIEELATARIAEEELPTLPKGIRARWRWRGSAWRRR